MSRAALSEARAEIAANAAATKLLREKLAAAQDAAKTSGERLKDLQRNADSGYFSRDELAEYARAIVAEIR